MITLNQKTYMALKALMSDGNMAKSSLSAIIACMIAGASACCAHADSTQVPTAPASQTSAAPASQPSTSSATEPPEKVIKVIVKERSDSMIGVATSASQGTVGKRELANKPIMRTGEILETVPGVIVTQHSGGGKANQYFFRGFNLDHGTDIAVYLDNMPVNMPTHAHGPGYADLNFVIPELVDRINYRKGSYSAEQGDFSSAGTIQLVYTTNLRPGLIETTGGNFGDRRFLIADSPRLSTGPLVYGLELYHYDGPWVKPDDFHRANGVIRYTGGDDGRGWDATAMAYTGKWNATDQIPLQAVDDGQIDRYGEINPADGGSSNRYSLSSEWHEKDSTGMTSVSAYAIKYRLDLFSDFTYNLFYPVQGDQIEQYDDRAVYGGQATRTYNGKIAGHSATNEFGLQARYDNIYKIGLYNTEDRVRFFTVSQDAVQQVSFAPFYENRISWSPHFRSVAGVRVDTYNYNVTSNMTSNSGNVTATMASPKLSLIYGPWGKTEYYLNAGEGFHSNDARAVTEKIDPNPEDGSSYLQPVKPDQPLTRSREAEIGVRTEPVQKLQTTFSAWYLHLDSELVFDPDIGSSVAGDPSQRLGLELTNYYTPSRNWELDGDFAYSWAKFTDNPAAGNWIPNSLEGVVGAGVSYTPKTRGTATLRWRYYGPEPLNQTDTVKSSPSSLVDIRTAYRLGHNYKIGLDVFNVFDTRAYDIEYYYTYRLPGQPASGVNGITMHPMQPTSIMVTLSRELW